MHFEQNFDYMRGCCHQFLASSGDSSQFMKSVGIRSYCGPYFLAFGLNTKRYEVPLRSQSECGRIRTRITLNTETFNAVRDSSQFITSLITANSERPCFKAEKQSIRTQRVLIARRANFKQALDEYSQYLFRNFSRMFTKQWTERLKIVFLIACDRKLQ